MKDEVIKILPPPDKPVGALTDREFMERRNGDEFPLPDQYLEFLQIYGAGILTHEPADYLTARSNAIMSFWSPTHPIPEYDLFYQSSRILQNWRLGEILLEFGPGGTPPESPPPFKCAFERNGLLPFGEYPSVDLCFEMSGHPSKWPIVIYDSFYEQRRFEVEFWEFLHTALTDPIDSFLTNDGSLESLQEQYYYCPELPTEMKGLDWFEENCRQE